MRDQREKGRKEQDAVIRQLEGWSRTRCAGAGARGKLTSDEQDRIWKRWRRRSRPAWSQPRRAEGALAEMEKAASSSRPCSVRSAPSPRGQPARRSTTTRSERRRAPRPTRRSSRLPQARPQYHPDRNRATRKRGEGQGGGRGVRGAVRRDKRRLTTSSATPACRQRGRLRSFGLLDSEASETSWAISSPTAICSAAPQRPRPPRLRLRYNLS